MNIHIITITLKEADKFQSDLLVEILNFRKQVESKNPENKQKKKYVLDNLHKLFKHREIILNAFDSKIFPIKIEGTADMVSDHSNLKILNYL